MGAQSRGPSRSAIQRNRAVISEIHAMSVEDRVQRGFSNVRKQILVSNLNALAAAVCPPGFAVLPYAVTDSSFRAWSNKFWSVDEAGVHWWREHPLEESSNGLEARSTATEAPGPVEHVKQLRPIPNP